MRNWRDILEKREIEEFIYLNYTIIIIIIIILIIIILIITTIIITIIIIIPGQIIKRCIWFGPHRGHFHNVWWWIEVMHEVIRYWWRNERDILDTKIELFYIPYPSAWSVSSSRRAPWCCRDVRERRRPATRRRRRRRADNFRSAPERRPCTSRRGRSSRWRACTDGPWHRSDDRAWRRSRWWRSPRGSSLRGDRRRWAARQTGSADWRCHPPERRSCRPMYSAGRLQPCTCIISVHKARRKVFDELIDGFSVELVSQAILAQQTCYGYWRFISEFIILSFLNSKYFVQISLSSLCNSVCKV